VRKITAVAAAALLIALAACDTEPATDVTSVAATLNGKGSCSPGLAGNWAYQIRKAGSSNWDYVGGWHSYDCGGGTTGEAALQAERAHYLTPGATYQYRIINVGNNGSQQLFDSAGTSGGTNYDTFTTPQTIVEDLPVEERDVTVEEFGSEANAAAAGCRAKEINNPRVYKVGILIKEVVVNFNLRTRWQYCHGQVTKMYPATTDCAPTKGGAFEGYGCYNKTKVRAYSLGGDPEHAVYTYSYLIQGKDPIHAITFDSKTVCMSNYVSGSGAHYRNGRCDLVPWGT
jgi:hypothetical protein